MARLVIECVASPTACRKFCIVMHSEPDQGAHSSSHCNLAKLVHKLREATTCFSPG